MSRSDVLVDADWVETQIGEPGIVIVEVDEDTSAYDKGHIPSAIKIDWKKDLQDPVRRDFVDKTGFEALLSERGISNDDTVVLYGGNNNWFAAYAYWYFKLYGHDKVLLLDGGRKKWELDSRELSTDVPAGTKTSYTASEQDSSLRALRDEVIDAIGKRNLVDVRSPDEFAGRLLAPAHLPQEQAQRGGHIPTAKNVPWSKAANEDGTFKSDDELATLYRDEAGVDFGKDTIAYCRIGERSAHTWFVLHEILGQPNVKNYDGSWTEYGSLVGVPIETGGGQVSNDSCGAPAGGVTITQGQGGQGGGHRGARAPRWRAGVPGLRPAARHRRRVRRRGSARRGRRLPLLRRARRVDAARTRARPGPPRAGGHGGHRPDHQGRVPRLTHDERMTGPGGSSGAGYHVFWSVTPLNLRTLCQSACSVGKSCVRDCGLRASSEAFAHERAPARVRQRA